jgi:hypothetical protein
MRATRRGGLVLSKRATPLIGGARWETVADEFLIGKGLRGILRERAEFLVPLGFERILALRIRVILSSVFAVAN